MKLNATFSRGGARHGSLALVSQSGALCTAILDWALGRQVGFSAVVSLGDAADVDFGDVLDYLALDPETKGILLYVEGVRHPRRFMSGLRVAARLKPTVVVKAGRHAEGSKAAKSHHRRDRRGRRRVRRSAPPRWRRARRGCAPPSAG